LLLLATPSVVLGDGDVVAVEVSLLGTLRNVGKVMDEEKYP